MIFERETTNIEVDSKIFTAKFACDYDKCGGACCWVGVNGVTLGGLLSYEETSNILFYKKKLGATLCESDTKELAAKHPVIRQDACFYTALHRDKCVFCNMREGGCVLKHAKDIGIPSVDIPLSCHLYPILWEYDTEKGVETLSLGNTFDEYCVHAYEKGEREEIFLLDFMKEPLCRAFGETFYEGLKKAQRDFI